MNLMHERIQHQAGLEAHLSNMLLRNENLARESPGPERHHLVKDN